ncbi:MAG: prefoldin subunit alpha [Candidatus Micrarchaeaceae archaeon]
MIITAQQHPHAENAQELDQLRYMMQVYQNQYGMMSNSINMALNDLRELNNAQKTIESNDSVKGKLSFTDLGAGFYMKSRIDEEDSVIVGVGGNYFVEKDNTEAKQYVARQVGRKTDELNKMIKNKKELEGAMMELSYKIEHFGHQH